jgi:hypothetical protein
MRPSQPCLARLAFAEASPWYFITGERVNEAGSDVVRSIDHFVVSRKSCGEHRSGPHPDDLAIHGSGVVPCEQAHEASGIDWQGELSASKELVSLLDGEPPRVCRAWVGRKAQVNLEATNVGECPEFVEQRVGLTRLQTPRLALIVLAKERNEEFRARVGQLSRNRRADAGTACNTGYQRYSAFELTAVGVMIHG